MRKPFLFIVGVLFLMACGSPAALESNQPDQLPRQPIAAAQAPKSTADQSGAMQADGTVVPSKPAEVRSEGAHSYEGDNQHSITIKAGDVFTCHNPDFSRGYTFTVISVAPDRITLSTDEPNVIIRDNGGKMPYMIHATESYATGWELPICWASFTPREKTPVVQTYSMQPGGAVVRDDDG